MAAMHESQTPPVTSEASWQGFDLVLGLTPPAIDHQLGVLQRLGIIRSAFTAEDGAGQLEAELAPRGVTVGLRMAEPVDACPRLILTLKSVRLDGVELPGPWRLALNTPVALTEFPASEWTPDRLTRAMLRRLEPFRDPTRFAVRRLHPDLRALDIQAALRPAESEIPSLPERQRARALALLQQHLRTLVGRADPFTFALLALSLDPERTAPDRPDCEPTSATWGVSLRPREPDGQPRSQLCLLMKTRSLPLPARPERSAWISSQGGPRNGGFILSQAFLVERLILPQVRSALALTEPFRPDLTNTRVDPPFTVSGRVEVDGRLHDVTCSIQQTAQVSVAADHRPDADLGQRAAVNVTTRFERTLRLHPNVFHSVFTVQTRLCAAATADGVLTFTNRPHMEWALDAASRRTLDAWSKGRLANLARFIEGKILTHPAEARALTEMSVRLRLNARLVLAGNEAWLFSDPFAGADAPALGPHCLRLSLRRKRT